MLLLSLLPCCCNIAVVVFVVVFAAVVAAVGTVVGTVVVAAGCADDGANSSVNVFLFCEDHSSFHC